MWILSKHPSLEGGSGNPQFYLLSGRKYVLGRKDCDIVISGDISISRRHAVISVANTDPAATEKAVEEISIIDTSKVGLQVNGGKITPNEETALKNGDLISFGRLQIKYKLIHQRLSVVTSCINNAESKATLKRCLKKLGGYAAHGWSDNSTHLIMDKVTFTMKVVCALACGKPVVSIKYIEDLLDCCDKKTSSNMPCEKQYLPPISEPSLVSHEELFHPNTNRKNLMVGKLFIVLMSQQHKRIKEPIQFAGGDVLLKESKDVKVAKTISSNQTIVLQAEKKDEKNASDAQKAWINEVYAKLKQHNLRPVRESEIGLAILYGSLASYCNPTLITAPAISGTTHTQIMADSMGGTQQSQASSFPMQPSQINMDITHINETIPLAPETFKLSVTQEGVTADGSIEKVGDEDQKNVTSVKRKRGNASSIDNTIIEEEDADDLFKKPKLHKNENEKKNTKKYGNERNIIQIDDDEVDVFSFNYSQDTIKPKEEDTKNLVGSRKQNSEAHKLVLDSVSAPTSTSRDIKGNGENYESVFCTSSSKKPIPETYFTTSSTTPVKKVSHVAPTVSLTHRNFADNDDDDPFSFSVNELDTNRKDTQYNNKSDGMSEKNNRKRKMDDISYQGVNHTFMNEKSENLRDSSSAVINMDHADKGHIQKENSRFLKGQSSTQNSNTEGIFISDDEGTLIGELNEKLNDFTDLYDDKEDIVNKEYSMKKVEKVVGLHGFLSTSDKKPVVNIAKDEDSCSIDIDNNLVNTIFVPLIVSNPITKEIVKIHHNSESKSKNYKTFKKQHYAGKSLKVRTIGKIDMAVYEGDDCERASLFANIREKDQQEASETRRIDRMFEPMVCR